MIYFALFCYALPVIVVLPEEGPWTIGRMLSANEDCQRLREHELPHI